MVLWGEQKRKKYQEESTKVSNVSVSLLYFFPFKLKYFHSFSESKGLPVLLNLSISGTNKQINEAVLNSIIDVIIEDRIIDQRQLSLATVNFIDKRLRNLTNTVDSISKQTIAYQLKNNIYNTDEQTNNLLSNLLKENEASFNLKIQLEIANSLLEQLKSQQKFEILPSNIGILDEGINELLVSFNSSTISPYAIK